MTKEQMKLLEGTLENYQITKHAYEVLKEMPLNHHKIGHLLNAHQRILRDALGISTPKIDHMIDSALHAGAYGAKINGSGGGGCMFAYAPENPEEVKLAIEQAGGHGYIINVDRGFACGKDLNNPG